MDTFTSQLKKPLGNCRQRGGTLIETIFAGAISLIAIGGGFSYLNNAIAQQDEARADQKGNDLNSILQSLTKQFIAETAKTDPCAKDTRLKDMVKPHYGNLGSDLVIAEFKPFAAAKEYKRFAGKYPKKDMLKQFGKCTFGKSNSACFVLRHKAKHAKHWSLVQIKQESFDFKSNKKTDHATCDNKAILDDENIDPLASGIGLKGSFTVLTAKKSKKKGKTKIKFKKTKGAATFSPTKSVILAADTSSSGQTAGKTPSTGASTHLAAKPAVFCPSYISRCNMPIPPDPGTDYAGWQAYSNRAASGAAGCKKCERARTYK